MKEHQGIKEQPNNSYRKIHTLIVIYYLNKFVYLSLYYIDDAMVSFHVCYRRRDLRISLSEYK